MPRIAYITDNFYPLSATFIRDSATGLASDFEGLPLALLEAMACRCAPLVSRFESGLADLLRDNESGLLNDIGDVEGFVTDIRRLTRSPTLLAGLRSSAYSVIGRGPYSSDAMSRAYIDLFDELLSRPSRRVIQAQPLLDPATMGLWPESWGWFRHVGRFLLEMPHRHRYAGARRK